MTYSASATDENYAMGLLWANVDDDLLDGYSWHKSEKPVFVSSERHHLYGQDIIHSHVVKMIRKMFSFSMRVLKK